MLSIIIVTHNSATNISNLLESLSANPLCNDLEIIVIDNGSTDMTLSEIEKNKVHFDSLVVVSQSENPGFARSCNLGATQARHEYLLFLNPDTLLLGEKETGYLKGVIEKGTRSVYGFLFHDAHKKMHPTIGVFPNILRVAADRLPFFKQRSGMLIRDIDFYRKRRSVDWVCGCGMLVPKEIFLESGGFDERYFMYVEDMELCKRLSGKGVNILFDPNISFIHYDDGATFRKKPHKSYRIRKGLLMYFRDYLPQWQTAMLRMLIKIESAFKLLPLYFKNEQSSRKKQYLQKTINL